MGSVVHHGRLERLSDGKLLVDVYYDVEEKDRQFFSIAEKDYSFGMKGGFFGRYFLNTYNAIGRQCMLIVILSEKQSVEVKQFITTPTERLLIFSPPFEEKGSLC